MAGAGHDLTKQTIFWGGKLSQPNLYLTLQNCLAFQC